MGDLRLDYLAPSADLAPYISSFYRFEASVVAFEDLERADRAQVRFRLTPGAASYRFPDGAEAAAPMRHILAPTSGATRARAEGPLLVFGAGLTPAGWAGLLGIDASVAVNRVLDADALLGPAAARLAAALAEADEEGGPEAMKRAAETAMRAMIREREDAIRFARLVDAWLAGAPSPELDALVGATGLSRRQVERRCKTLYGAPPKLLARKYRALRAVAALGEGPDAWDRFVADGFYDQSHLIREVRRFVGLTPGEVRRERSPLHRLTVDGRRSLRGQVAILVSET